MKLRTCIAAAALLWAPLAPAAQPQEPPEAGSSEDPGALDALAASLREQKKLDQSESVSRRVLERHPRDAQAHKNLALIEVARGRDRLAAIALTNARKLDPSDPAIPNALGILALRRKEPAEARQLFAESVKLDPTYAVGWANLGALALSYRDYATAQEAYANAARLDPERVEMHLGLAWALEGAGHPAGALAEYDKVLELRPGQDEALYGRALALKADNQLAAAKEAFERLAAQGAGSRAAEARAQIASIDLRMKSAASARAVPELAGAAK
ncbi:MAG TPA: tetratricopeptide repeat protein [Myxococcales bacterium]|nr:tetratricopeptide repeat protein [Myxococcales bacterium]